MRTRHRFRRLAAVLFLLSTVAAPTVRAESGWVLTFHDEFDGTQLDEGKWSNGYGWGVTAGHASGYCDPANNIVANGILIQVAENRPQGDRAHSVGCIHTKDKFSQLHGFWEARMKVPSGVGLHSAFWAKPHNDAWPPELDVEEIPGGRTDRVTTTVHWEEGGIHYRTNNRSFGPDFSQDYHIFGAHWSPAGTIWYVDGIEKFRTSDGASQMAEKGPFYTILNLQVNLRNGEQANESTTWPAYQYVDYVRVWARS